VVKEILDFIQVQFLLFPVVVLKTICFFYRHLFIFSAVVGTPNKLCQQAQDDCNSGKSFALLVLGTIINKE
jgi:hypothetical protein